MEFGSFFVAEFESAIVMDGGDGAFDDVTGGPESGAVGLAAVSDHGCDVHPAEQVFVILRMVGAVSL